MVVIWIRTRLHRVKPNRNSNLLLLLLQLLLPQDNTLPLRLLVVIWIRTRRYKIEP